MSSAKARANFLLVMLGDLTSININLNLTQEELSQFYWNIYGSSLIEYHKSAKAKKGYIQVIEQLESFFIKQDPDNIFKIQEVKDRIKKSIQIRKAFN